MDGTPCADVGFNSSTPRAPMSTVQPTVQRDFDFLDEFSFFSDTGDIVQYLHLTRQAEGRL